MSRHSKLASASVQAVAITEFAALFGERTCRECGCGDFSACLDAQHTPCHWVEEGLCSACALPHVRLVSEGEANEYLRRRHNHA